MSELEGFDYLRFTGSAHGVSDWVDEDALERKRPAGFVEREAEVRRVECSVGPPPPENSVSTAPGTVRYISPDQIESWARAEWGYGDAA